MPSTPRSSRTDSVRTRRSTGTIPRVVIDAAPLVALGVLFISSDVRFAFTDDEATTLNTAAQSFRAIFAAFRANASVHPHPPLYDFLLHLWLLATNGAPALLRLPAVLLFLLGAWVLSRAAVLMGGELAGTSMVWLIALGPFGFHYGRLASGYSFSFLLVAAVIWAYLKYLAAPSRPAGALVCLLAVLLVWTSYFGLVLLLLLAVEEILRNRAEPAKAARRIGIAAAVVLVISIPLWRGLLTAARQSIAAHLPLKGAILNVAYSLYVLQVSESVAPWYWKFGVPAMIAAAAVLVLISIAAKDQSRRFLIYGAILLACLAVTGTRGAESLLLVAPWFLLAGAVAIGTTHTSFWRRSAALALAVVAGVGWYGVVARLYYATPRFIEPWGNLAVEAGTAVREGGAVIANSPSFFLYLTYALRVPDVTPWHFVGSLPTLVQYPEVWGPEEWLGAGQPVKPTVLWIAEMPLSGPMEKSGDALDHACGDRTERRMVRDSAFAFRQRFLGEKNATPWLVEVRQYSCGPNSETAPAPAPQ